MKKCIVFSVTGVLCFQDPTRKSDRYDLFANFIRRPGVLKLFSELMDSEFSIGIWSGIPRIRLIPLLKHLVPEEIFKKFSFVWGREMCDGQHNISLCYKPLRTLMRKRSSKDVCKEDQVLIVDDWPLRHRINPELGCLLPFSYMGQKGNERARNGSIGNIATELLTYLLPLRLYPSVSDYIKDHYKPGQLHHERYQDKLYKRERGESFYYGSSNC
jgi:NLI interacting factor-like phosphatase